MKNISEEGITLLRYGFCDVKGRIESEPSNHPYRCFSVYNKNGVRLGTIDSVTEEGRKALEKVDGKFVRFRSYPPADIESDKIFYLYLKS